LYWIYFTLKFILPKTCSPPTRRELPLNTGHGALCLARHMPNCYCTSYGVALYPFLTQSPYLPSPVIFRNVRLFSFRGSSLAFTSAACS